MCLQVAQAWCITAQSEPGGSIALVRLACWNVVDLKQENEPDFRLLRC